MTSRKPVPKADPVPSPRLSKPRPSMLGRFWQIFRLLALLAVVVAGISVLLVARGDPQLHVHMLIATALGAGFIMLVGSTLMVLTFLSASSGHDEVAHHPPPTERADHD